MAIPKVWKKRSRGMKSNSFGMKSHPKGIQIYSLKVWKYTQRYENNVDGMKKYQWYQGMKKMLKVWKRCPRYEKCAQSMKNVPKVWNSWLTVHFHTLRYEIGVFLKNSGFLYLYWSISYLFGYENIGCFSLMTGFSAYGIRARATPVLRQLPVHMAWDREDYQLTTCR